MYDFLSPAHTAQGVQVDLFHWMKGVADRRKGGSIAISFAVCGQCGATVLEEEGCTSIASEFRQALQTGGGVEACV